MTTRAEEIGFSVCIPNYNYARYLGQTIESVLAQTHQNFEIIIADNASTDDSVAVAKRYQSERVRIIQNRHNIGFAPNLDRVTQAATKDQLLVLSSDDLMRPKALATYAATLADLGTRARRTVLTSAIDVVDSDGKLTAVHYRPAGNLFYIEATPDQAQQLELESVTIERRSGHEALRESLQLKNAPAAFLATCYSRELYQDVEGYNSGYRMWPDVHFLYKLLSKDSELVYVPQRLFAYRVHNQNQGAGEHKAGAIKYQLDAYLHTLEFPPETLEQIGVSRHELERIFIEKAVMERGLQAMAASGRERALKCLAFGFATYPKLAIGEPKTYALAGLLALGPAGHWVAERLYAWHRSYRQR